MADLHFFFMTLAVSLVTPLCCEAQQIINLPSITLLVGTSTSIPCGYDGRVSSVEWQKGELGTLKAEEYVVMLDARYNPGKRTYFIDRFNVTDDSALTIAGVRVEDEGRYFCTVFDDSSGTFISSATDVFVESPPTGPFPTIDVCKTTQNCTHLSSTAVNLTCSVDSYFPNISLVFLHDQEIMAALSSKETSNSDGTKNKEILIPAAPSDEPYACRAFGIPGMDGWKSAVVMITGGTEWKAPNTTLIIAVVVTAGSLVAVAIAASMMVYVHRKRRAKKQQGSDEEGQKQQLLPLEEKWTEPITSPEVRKFASHLTQRCRTRLNSVLSTGKAGTKKENKPGDDKFGTVEENMFDTPKMIHDWIAQQDESNPYGIRCKLWEAAIKAGCYDVFDGSEPCLPDNMKCGDSIMTVLGRYQRNYMSKNEIQQSMKYLKQENKYQVLEKLGIKTSKKMTDGDIVRDLCEWRDDKLSTSEVELRKLFYDTVNALEYQECVAEPNGDFVFDAELPSIGFAMLMEDILPFSEALGLDRARLHKYRKPPTARCVLPEIGHLVKDARKEKGNTRAILCESLVKTGFTDIARMLFLGQREDQSLSEMYMIISNLNEEQMSSLVEKLGLTQEDIDSCRKTPEKRKLLKVIKRWRRKEHPPRYYYREELANAIKHVQRHQQFARKMLKDVETNVHETFSSLSNLSEEEAEKLAPWLGLSDAEHDSVTEQIYWPFSSRKITHKHHLIRLWRNKLQPASYNYSVMLDEAKCLMWNDKAVSSVEDDISYAEESTKDLLAELPDLDDSEVTVVASRLGLKKDEIESCSGYDEKLELLKLWKRKIHTPYALYHYRQELDNAVKSMENLEEHVIGVLSGRNVPEGPNPNVINDIYSNMSKAEVERIEDILVINGQKIADQEMKDEESFSLYWNVMIDKLFYEGFSALAHELILLSCYSSSKEKKNTLSELLELSSSLKQP